MHTNRNHLTWRSRLACCVVAALVVASCGNTTANSGNSSAQEDGAVGSDGQVSDGAGDAPMGDSVGQNDSSDSTPLQDILDAIDQELSDGTGDGTCENCDTTDDSTDTTDGGDVAGGCEFPANPLPGSPGSTCTTAGDCDNGLCIPNGKSKICTTTCSSCCPSGFACDLVANGSDSVFMCVPKLFTLCAPCKLDSDCAGTSSKGALCISYGGSGSFCGGTCQLATDCPGGYVCQDAVGQAGAGKQCVRAVGECTCSAESVTAGATTVCAQVSTFGTCSGLRKCTANGLSACDAPVPATETCNGKDDDCDGQTDPVGAQGCIPYFVDSDGDLVGGTDSQCLCGAKGAYVTVKGGDCNDGDKAIHPAAFDGCNGIDDNCNGKTDEAYGDLDGDGIADCVDGDMDGDSYANAADCSPTNAAIYPGATEICDGLDDDCNGVADEVGTPGCTPYFTDADGDGAGDKSGASTCLCAPSGLSTAITATDCNDSDATVKPSADELCDGVDNDCNGVTDDGCDDDGDGWCDGNLVVIGTPPICKFGSKDCDDANATQNPGQKESCGNGVDDNCDGNTDGGVGSVGCTLLFDDTDGDGVGAGSGVCLCAPEGLVTATVSGDCDDTNPAIKPGAAEICSNGKDDNCNGLSDEPDATGCTLWYVDKDKDSFGAGIGACLCASDAAHPVANHADCDDGSAAVSPNAAESCNGVDDNCNSQTDEAGATGCTKLHADLDGDGFGAPAKSACLCVPNADFPVANATDCNDAVATISPAATETCNGIDDNCDGNTDDVNSAGCQIYFADADNDTWGNAGLSLCLCSPLTVFTVKKSGDCNDNNNAMYPGNKEFCDGVDNDCNGTVDEAGAIGCKTYLRDHDSDGYGSTTEPTQCLCGVSGEYSVSTGGDCNDSDNKVHPTAPEICNSIDDDCDGSTDPVGAGGCSPWYVDGDGDGFGTFVLNSQCLCKGAAGFAPKGGDCNDAKATVNPSEVDVCNGVDDNCDGVVDPKGAPGCQNFYADGDGDGFGVVKLAQCTCSAEGVYTATVVGDCNDAVATVNPTATETCNGVDDNCNSLTDENLKVTYYLDIDGDAWGTGAGVSLCQADDVHTATKSGDCNDAKSSINPGASESCNATDDNCDGNTDEGLATVLWFKDIDGDTFGGAPGIQLCGPLNGYTVTAGGDCNDLNQAVSPGGNEICNGVDDNCNGQTDEVGATGCTIYFRDADGDGISVASDTQCLCAKSGVYTATVSGDCNDAAATISPKVTESCNGIDDNCDGLTDVPGSNGCTTYYVDADGDAYGSQIAPTQCLCTKLLGFATQAGDCNDNDSAVNPAATEVCNGKDDNCDGVLDPVNAVNCVSYYGDGDLDGYGGNLAQCACGPKGAFTALVAGDCNDQAFGINPGATEICDGIDQNCNSQTDEGLTKAYYVDTDNDGYGAGIAALLCSANATFTANKNGDCDDTKASINPGATEACNGIDDNCNTGVDEGLPFATYYQDADTDGYGAVSINKSACSQPAGYVANALDCNDANASIKPNAAEICNAVDDNCDGGTDEGLSTTTFYKDTDGDGFGNPLLSVAKCSQPSGYVTTSTDCNDSNAAVKPGTTEVCNTVDDNCNGVTDEGVQTIYYLDQDNDNYGNPLLTKQACTQPGGYVSNALDCNDSNSTMRPGAIEACNSLDDNCNGSVDEGLPTGTYYLDFDGDGYGNAASSISKCLIPIGYVANASDCNDSAVGVHPGAPETCNGIDDNCDTNIDEGVKTTFYRDADLDGYGNLAVTTNACSAPSGYILDATDCNDTSGLIHPGATETTCDGIDQDCNGTDLCPCSATTLNALDVATGITMGIVPGSSFSQWSISSVPITPTLGTKALQWSSLSYNSTDGWYSTAAAGESATLNVTVPTGGAFVMADLIINNNLSSGADTTMKVTMTLDGAAQVFGPFATTQTGVLKTVKWPIAVNRWNTPLQFKANVYTTNTSAAAVGGVMVDNIRVVCN